MKCEQKQNVELGTGKELQFSILGIGSSGCKMIRYLLDNNKFVYYGDDSKKDSVTFIAVHNNVDDLVKSGADKTLLFTNDHLILDENDQLSPETREYLYQGIGNQLTDVDMIVILPDFSDTEMIHSTNCFTKLLADSVINSYHSVIIAIINEPSPLDSQIEHNSFSQVRDQLLENGVTFIVNSSQQILRGLRHAQRPLNEYQLQSFNTSYQAIKIIWNCLYLRGIWDFDFSYLARIVQCMGEAIMVIGYGQGDDRAQTAVDNAVNELKQEWGYLKNPDICGLFFNIVISDILIDEYDLILNSLFDIIDDASIRFSGRMSIDPSMENGDIAIGLLLVKKRNLA